MTTDTNRQTPSPGLSPVRQAERQKLTDAVRAEYRHELNVPYGNHPKQILDIYYPRQGTAVPVYVFLHGGGFRGGAPGVQGFVGRRLLDHGAMFVSMGYRLIPDAYFPDSCDDVELGLRWLREHIGERGGDPNRLYLSGHSAGAGLAASVALRNWVSEPDLPADLLKGLVLFSGVTYDRDAPSDTQNPKSRRYVPRLTESIERIPPHTVVVSTDNDFPGAPEGADAIVAAIQSRGGSVQRFVESNADHFAATQGLASGGAVFEAARTMMQLD